MSALDSHCSLRFRQPTCGCDCERGGKGGVSSVRFWRKSAARCAPVILTLRTGLLRSAVVSSPFPHRRNESTRQEWRDAPHAGAVAERDARREATHGAQLGSSVRAASRWYSRGAERTPVKQERKRRGGASEDLTRR